MSDLTPMTEQAPADDLLYGFDICDEETKLFLSSLIASGHVPQADLDELHDLSLARGVEEWDMLFQCASVLRERSGALRRADSTHAERSLVPFLGAVLGGRPGGSDAVSALNEEHAGTGKARERRKAGASRKKGPRRGVSHFWGEESDASEAAGLGPRYEDGLAARPQGLRRGQEVPATASKETIPSNGALRGAVQLSAQDTRPTSPPAATAISTTIPEDASNTVAPENRDCTPLVLSDKTDCAPPGPRKDVEPAVKAKGGSKSPFFGTPTPTREKKAAKAEPTPPSTKKKPRPPRGTVSGLPIPPLSADRFGLIQEELAGDPFRLLIAITFLIRTTGKAAIPVFRQLMERCPTPQTLAAADPADIIPLIRPLGLAVVRCAAIQKYARMWLERPPTREVRYGVKNYPQPGDWRHVRVGEEFGPEDGGGGVVAGGQQHQPMDAVADARERGIGCAWEIGHLTQGPYALDSWRIFCRDVLLGRSGHWTGKGSEPGFQPEWMRVLPRDKELRACLRWMWYVSRMWLSPPPFCAPEAAGRANRHWTSVAWPLIQWLVVLSSVREC